MSGMVKVIIGGLVFFMFVIVFFTPSENANYNVQVNNLSTTAAEGLSLQAVGAILKDVKTAEDFEQKLNDPSVGVNNLDLDENGVVDYIKVTEYGEGDVRGFSLTTELAPGDEQEVATIEIEKVGEQANVEMQGNSQIYGNGHYHRSSFSFVDMMLLSYLFSPRMSYMSPYGYGNYPSNYRSYETRSAGQYRNQMPKSGQFQRTQSSSISKNVVSPNSGKSASRIKAPLRNPTVTQKSFQARNPSKTLRSGGFGSPSKPRPMMRSSGFSGSSFGGK